jgi:hypothetical protein
MADAGIPRYDRDFLLSPAKRNQIVELWEVEKFGRDSFGDPDAVCARGPNFPLSRLESWLRRPACGSRRVTVVFEPPTNR